MNLHQLRAFVFWMCRKACLVPARFVGLVTGGLTILARTVHEDGFVGVAISFLISFLGFFIGMMSGGLYEEAHKVPGTFVPFDQILQYGFIGFATMGGIIFFYTCWYCFKQEQKELFDKLKDGYDHTT